jgi:hypothetical protein
MFPSSVFPFLISVFLGVHDLLVNSIMKTDLDLRRVLFSQIVLSGGSTLFPGFGDRLLSEIKTHPNSPKNTKIRISAPTERLSSVWIGKISHFILFLIFSCSNSSLFLFFIHWMIV